MARLTANVVVAHPKTGEPTVLVADSELPSWATELVGEHVLTDDEPGGYGSMKVDELKAEIDSRNEGREEADLIPSDGRKADLIAALEADDESAE